VAPHHVSALRSATLRTCFLRHELSGCDRVGATSSAFYGEAPEALHHNRADAALDVGRGLVLRRITLVLRSLGLRNPLSAKLV